LRASRRDGVCSTVFNLERQGRGAFRQAGFRKAVNSRDQNFTQTKPQGPHKLITTPADDGVEVLDVERVPYRKALELAMSGAIMQAAHVASLILGLRAAGKIELRLAFAWPSTPQPAQ
jgi:hypothetical protein